jgi:hypothetical protein
MSEIKETVTTSQDSGVSETGANVQQETRKVNTDVATDGKTTAANVVWYILGLIEVLLAFRFVLKLFGANPSSGFVDFIYSVTGVLTMPFDRIFTVATPESGDVVRSVFEPSILVAAVVYALIAWGIVKLMTINRPNDSA